MSVRSILVLLLAVSGAACDDSLGPGSWNATPDTVVIHSLSRPELLGFPSAFDFVSLIPVRVESPSATGNWDVALMEQEGEFVLAPAGVFPGQQNSRAAIARIQGTAFEDLTEAPNDTSLFSSAPVALTEGAVYVIRSRRAQCDFTTAVRYAKIKAVTVDEAAGSLRFAVVRNPFCNDRSFIPPED